MCKIFKNNRFINNKSKEDISSKIYDQINIIIILNKYLARILELKTVVEGVETKEQLDELKEMGCDSIQGYYYSKPVPKADFEKIFA